MVDGVRGEVATKPVVPELRQEHAQILNQQMEETPVLEPQANLVTLNHVPQV